MKQEKKLTEVFKGCDIPEEFNDTRVCALKIDTDKRKIELALRFSSVLPYSEIEDLKSKIKKAYVLNSISAHVFFDDKKCFENKNNLRDYILGELCDRDAAYKCVFEGSDWNFSEDSLCITIKHDCGEYIRENKTESIIRNILKKWDCDAKISFAEEIDDTISFEPVKASAPAYAPKKAAESSKGSSENPAILLGRPIFTDPVNISDVDAESGFVTIRGDIFFIDTKEISNGKTIVTFYLKDDSGAIICKFFIENAKYEILKGDFKKGLYVTVKGKAEFDKFEQDVTVTAKDINLAEKIKKRDNAEKKRVELHAHTKMSTMDGIANAKDLVKLAKQYGHSAVAITDHGVVQAFPEAFHEKDDSIKILYGTEAYLINDCDNMAYKGGSYPMDGEIVVFDIETTGLSPQSEEITEIGAVLVKNGEILDKFETFVNPGKPIPQKIVELTGITDDMVADAPSPRDAVLSFMEFCGDRPLIAHNADFDTGFIRETLSRNGVKKSIRYLDTLALCRALVKEKKRHKLDIMAEYFGVPNPSHHRAVNDAEVCAGIWFKCAEKLSEMDISDLTEIDGKISINSDLSRLKPFHAVIFAKNLVGLKNLYKLVSMSHLNYFKRNPRIPKSELIKHRDGLLLGSACEAGELYRALRKNADDAKIKRICEFYDYYEIQPLGNNMFMVGNGEVQSVEDIKNFNRRVIELGEEYGKPVVATGDVHFLNAEDEVFRRILMASKGFSDADNQAPLYYRTTNEMLAEFDYLDPETARRVVIDNTNLIADMIEDIRPVPEEKCPPVIEGSAEDIERMCREKATRIYGDPLPELVEERMKKELTSIINNGFAVMYMIAHKLVKKSLEDGYLVGSRGSVGSSFVAFLTDITEVNSLPPHYVCPKCKYSEFITDMSVGSGCDMEDKNCPHCGEKMKKDGHDIPFETFLGFNGDKAPDIDLNFSGDYQPIAHKYTEVIFGTGHVFRAGTIGTVAEKTAYGYIKNYFEERGRTVRKAEMQRLIEGCTGVKRTTGQHPGGVIVLPKGHDIHEFTPVQHPADKSEIDIITTHFDYHSIDQNLLKLDLLGHDDPTVIRMLEDLTGTDAQKIPLDDKDTMSLFTGTGALGVTEEQISSKVGTYAIPEFGTKFVRQMLVDTKPTTFSELIRISGLSHGTDVWTNNAQELVRNGTCTLSSCICTRDDIMIYLINKGLPPSDSFKIMESVRKGKGLKPDWETLMRENSVPEWYIDSCKKIKYMFPKAHACAYVTMAFRIAYYKVHYPREFYMTYFSVRADSFEYNIMCRGADKARETIKQINANANATPKDKTMIPILEVCVEMYERGIEFCPIDLYKSHATKFTEENGKIRPPLNALPGVGTSAAQSIADERENGEFLAKDDMVKRCGITKAVVEALSAVGVLEGMQESTQVSMF